MNHLLHRMLPVALAACAAGAVLLAQTATASCLTPAAWTSLDKTGMRKAPSADIVCTSTSGPKDWANDA